MDKTRRSNRVPPEEMEVQRAAVAQVRRWNEENVTVGKEQRSAYILTLGCQQNEADSERLGGMAEEMGYRITSTPDQASLILVNTCAIREHAEKRALSLVGQFKHLKEKRPELIIGICGCMVVQEHRSREIKQRYPYVDLLFGVSMLHRFPELLWRKIREGKRVICTEAGEYLVAEEIPVHREHPFRAWVSVMYGCNNFCSYCIVPYVRGRERSRSKDAVFAEVKSLVDAGYKDITLLGQNVNSYGKDLGGEYDFADLLAELDTIEGDYWLHFMTSHPKDATKKLIDTMASSRHVARHFHLPMQSGSDRILQAMNRRYSFEKYIGTLDYIREKMPGAVVTSDIIVGFPGETEEDFLATLNALERARFDMIFSFIYSPRRGTPAAELDCQIEQREKSQRYQRLLAVQNDISLRANQKLEGQVLRVLCDGPSKNREDVYSGRTEGGKIVFLDPCPDKTGCFASVRIERSEPFALYGKIIEN